MGAHFSIHAGDTRPLPVVLEDAIGPINLTLYDEVRFLMWADLEDAPVIDALATILDAPVGSAQYEWKPGGGATPGETDLPGRYFSVFRAISDSATPGQVTFPSDRYLIVEILP